MSNLKTKLAVFLAALIAVFFIATNAFGTSVSGTAVGPTAVTGTPKVEIVECTKVKASRYNKFLYLRAKITGNRKLARKLHKTKPVCIKHLVSLKKDIRKKRKKCIRRSILTGASYYGYGDNSPANSASGAYGTLHNRSFAELGMGSAMGGLPPNSWWYISHAGSNFSVRGEKRDIGAGGGPIAGLPRGIDLYEPLLYALRMRDNGAVFVSKYDCWAKLK